MISKIKNLIAFYKTKKGKTTFFFGFYAIFFLCLFIFISMLDKPAIQPVKVTNNNEFYKFDIIENTSYREIVTIQENNVINTLENKKEFEYSRLLELTYIKKLLKNAKYLNKTMYGNNTCIINYEINNRTINDILEKNMNLEDKINPINLKTDNESNVLEIEYDFSNYEHSLRDDISIYKVLIKYEY